MSKISKPRQPFTPNLAQVEPKRKAHDQAAVSPQARIDEQVMAQAGSRMFKNVLQSLPAPSVKPKSHTQAVASPQAQVAEPVPTWSGSRMFQNVLQGLPASSLSKAAKAKQGNRI
jgi:hypothetical protein